MGVPEKEDSEVKTKVIKYFVLNYFSSFLANDRSLIRHRDKLSSFINETSQNLASELQRMGVQHLNTVNFQRISLYRQNHIRGISFSLLVLLSSALFSLLVAKAGRYFVDEMVLKTTQINCDQLQRDIEYEAKMFVAFLGVGFWINSVFLTAYYVDRYKLIDMNKSNYLLGWEEITLNDFITANIQRPEIKSIFGIETERMGEAWSRWSHLSVLDGMKSPAMLRSYYHFELNFLEKNMDISEFCKLLSCLLFESPPPISDSPYQIPIDVLRSPEPAWTLGTNLARKNCGPLLQLYIRLAIIEYLELEIGDKNVTFNKGLFLKLLSERKEYFNNVLHRTNNQELRNKFISEEIELLIRTAVFLVGTVIGGLIFYFKFHDLKETDPKCISSKQNTIFFLVLSLVMLLKITDIDKRICSLLNSDKLQNEPSSSSQFFTSKVISVTPELKAIFDNSHASNLIC